MMSIVSLRSRFAFFCREILRMRLSHVYANDVRRSGVIMAGKRYRIQFPNRESFMAAQAAEANAIDTPVANVERYYLAVEMPQLDTVAMETVEFSKSQVELLAQNYGAEIVEDYQYDLESVFAPEMLQPEDPAQPSMDDVLEMIRAREAWQDNRGADVAIAIVDTGIDGTRPEFPVAKRKGAWQVLGNTPWTDWQGHGTMCATIAAGTRANGGEFDGVAPDAGLIACKTRFYDTELTAIYDYLTQLALGGMTIVASNSWGIRTGTPPAPPPNTLVADAINRAMAAGVMVVFSAGNYHQLAGGAPSACSPTSIWLQKCRDEFLTVATCKLDQSMWYYSSRGLGQLHGTAGTNDKPDVTAPTPANGRIVFGNSVKSLADGWGTSGACPQVSGLSALMRTKRPAISRVDLQNAIRSTARPFGVAHECGGAGIIDCAAALSAI
jgi:serine protease AprX